MTNYIIRVQDRSVPGAFTWTDGWVHNGAEMAAVYAPIYRTASVCRLYLYECLNGTTTSTPVGRAPFTYVDPEDSNHILVQVETLSGAALFTFDFYLVEPELTP